MNEMVITLENAREAVQNQWKVIQECVEDAKREALNMGTLLIRIEHELTGPRNGRLAAGLGLKGWIEENLPAEIASRYATLMRWKQAAASLMRQARLENVEAVALLTGDAERAKDIPTPSVQKYNELMEAKTLTQLVFDFSEEKKAPGRKPGMNVESYKNLKKTPAENAQYAWARVIVTVYPALEETACLLPHAYAAEALARLEPLVGALKRRVAEQ